MELEIAPGSHDYLIDTLAESVQEFFVDYGFECTPSDHGTIPPPQAESVMGSVVGIRNDNFRGGLAFVAPTELVARTLPVPPDAERQEIQLRDWSAEIVNQLAGRFKNKLSARAFDFDVGTAVCFRGMSIRSAPLLPSSQGVALSFDVASANAVRVYLDCSLLVGDGQDASLPVLPEGGLVFF